MDHLRLGLHAGMRRPSDCADQDRTDCQNYEWLDRPARSRVASKLPPTPAHNACSTGSYCTTLPCTLHCCQDQHWSSKNATALFASLSVQQWC